LFSLKGSHTMSRKALFITLLFAVMMFATAALQSASPAVASASDDATPEATPEADTVLVMPLREMVNVREAPGTQSAKLGLLQVDDSLTATGYSGFDLTRGCSPDFQHDLDMWIRVDFNGRDGWIARCALKITDGRLSSLERVDTPEATPEA
jgi:hypothetical protein